MSRGEAGNSENAYSERASDIHGKSGSVPKDTPLERALSPLGVIGAALGPFAPAISMVLTAFAGFRRRPRVGFGRTIAVVLPLLFVGFIQAVTGRLESALFLLAIALLAFGVLFLGRLSIGEVHLGTNVALWCLVALAVFVLAVDTFRWHAPEPNQMQILDAAGVGASLVSGTANFRTSALRRWMVVGTQSPPRLSVGVRVVEGEPGYHWITSEANTFQTVPGDSVAYETLMNFTATSQFAYRSLVPGGLVGGRTFSGHVYLRSHSAEDTCGAVSLGAHQTGPFTRLELCVGDQWERVELEWVGPTFLSNNQVDLVIGGFSSPIAVARSSIFEARSDEARETVAPPLLPVGVTLRLTWGQQYPFRQVGQSEVVSTVLPTEEITFLEADVPVGIAHLTALFGALHVEDGITIEVVEAKWVGARVIPTPTIGRLALFTDHPNILGHIVAALGFAAVMTATTLKSRLVPLIPTLLLILLTGSRTALAAFLVAYVVIVLPDVAKVACFGPRKFRGAWSITLAVGVVVVGAVLFASLLVERPQLLVGGDTEVSSLRGRMDIWRVAITATKESPWLGASTTFTEAWAQRFPSAATVPHPHNAVLDVAYRAGVPAVLALLWAFAGFVAVAQASRRKALATVVLFGILNCVDVTYGNAAVLVPVGLALVTGDSLGVRLWRARMQVRRRC